ncbi:MAG: excinuclease ABC subunit UvrC [Candidatus Kerfeldbacteria bacterium]|nr:excinuclease ABC subunit UvrC [Candidatus Kerfeldbacteria bacterium]
MTLMLTSTIAHLPHKPGVYLFSDARGNIMYVGKARDLRKRVSSYFQRTNQFDAAKREMVAEIASLATIVTPTEHDALILEATQIKRHQPRFNVMLRDDRSFLTVRINRDEPYPSVEFVRRAKPRQGTRIFGPYTSARDIRQSLRLLKRLLPYRTCGQGADDPCFDARLGRCAGHDLGPHSREQYRAIIAGVMDFLDGRTEPVLAIAKQRMEEASHNRHFELAAKLRDQIRALEHLTSHQVVVGKPNEERDVVGLARAKSQTAVAVLRIRGGRIIDSRTFLLTARADEASTVVIQSFLDQYYLQTEDRPREVVVRIPPAETPAIEEEMPGILHVSQRGRGRELVAMADENAAVFLERKQREAASDAERGRRATEALMVALHLPKRPERIETYDVSNIQGTNPVGSMVVFTKGLPDKAAYRKFSVKSVPGSDDFAMLAEVLRRRVKNRDWPLPDLFVIDGGKGQLSAVMAVLDEAGVKTPTIGLAKREEEVFRPGHRGSLKLPPESEALLLLERMRDEAHRFAIGFYRGKHERATVRSILDEIPGIGPKTKKLLLQTFGSTAGIRRASDAELEQLVGARKREILREHL